MNPRYGLYLGIFMAIMVLVGAGAFGLLALFGGDELYKESSPYRNPAGYQQPQSAAPIIVSPPVRKEVSVFPEATSTWESRFTPVKPALGTFVAYYFDTNASTTLLSIVPKIVHSADAKFEWDYDTETGKGMVVPGGEKHRLIRAENFGAYWSTSFSLSARENRNLYVVQGSAAHTRVIIDGRTVFDGTNKNGMVPLVLTSGIHTMNVEFESKNSLVGFSATLLPEYELSTSKRAVSIDGVAPLRRFFAYVNESANFDNTIRVIVDRSTVSGTLVVWLHSNNTVHWDLSAIPPNTIAEVTIDSHSGASSAIHVPEGTEVFYSAEPDKNEPDYNHPDKFPGQVEVYSASVVRLAEKATASTDR